MTRWALIAVALQPMPEPSCSRCAGRQIGYTTGMKTAISLPDALFVEADRHAKRARKSRSQLYAEAIAEYLHRHSPEEITEAMNRVADQLEPGPDPFVLAASRAALERIEW